MHGVFPPWEILKNFALGWRLEGGRLEGGGWRLTGGGWRLEAGRLVGGRAGECKLLGLLGLRMHPHMAE